MKKLVFLLIAGYSVFSATAQTKKVKNYTPDKDLGRWVIDLNLMGGGYNQQMDVANTSSNYLNGINVNTGNVGFKNGSAFGGNAQLGVFLGKNKHWGLGTGVLYLRESGDVTLNNFHAEYQSVDNNGFVFRQVVSANNITEHVKMDNFNIPLVLKYKNRFSKHWGFTADAGVMFNLKTKTLYNTNASFDYEAIYKFVANGDGGNTAVYETSVIPATNDFLITRSHFIKNNPTGSVTDYFDAKRSEGYNVGLGVSPNQKTGTTNYATGSVGFIFQPSLNYFLSDHVALNIGGYFLYQPFKNDGTATYTMTGKPGEYSSVTNSVSKVQTQSYGGNIGVRFFLGKKAAPLNITGIDRNPPTICGLCDGNIALHGLEAGKHADIHYKVNGSATPTVYSGVVSPDGTVVVSDLCAGTYTDIQATIGRRTANSAPVTLEAPALVITSVRSTDPSAKGACDATITLYGLNAGQKASVTYSLNGVTQSAYLATVAPDNSIKLSGLCEGAYTDITVMSNKCKSEANPATFTLSAPTPEPVAEEVPVVTTVEAEDLQSVLFDFNTSTIKPESYSLINAAYTSLKEDRRMYLIIDGNTDAIGSDAYNQSLSERRAQAVCNYLVRKGISRNRIKIKASGEKEPVAPNNTKDGRKQNRRAEMLIRIKG